MSVKKFKHAVAAFVLLSMNFLPLSMLADETRLLEQLKQASPESVAPIERELQLQWSKSGSRAVDLLTSRGEKALKQGQINKAIEHLSAAIDHAPKFAMPYRLRAAAFMHLDQLGLAMNDLGQALTLNPSDYEALFSQGLILHELGENERAKKAYLGVLDLHPHHENVSKALKALDSKRIGHSL